MFKYILFLILLWIKIIYTLKQCDDCVVYTSCPNAMELARRQVHGDIFQTAFCGFDISQPRSPPMVCCSDFAAAAGIPGIESIGGRIGAPESDEVERTTPTTARAEQCDDCVVYTSCPNAMELARRKVHGEIFGTAFCGYDISQSISPPMVCCSDFAAAAGNTGIQSIDKRNRVVKSDQVEQCADCVTYTSCPRALESFQQRKNQKIFQRAFCGYDTTHSWRVSKVCCSQFDPVPIESHPNARLLPVADCGDIDGNRIIGGWIAGLYEFPWMTLIATQRDHDQDFTCGGSIINSRYILTAAHCIHNHNVAGVRVGDYDITSPTDCQGLGREYICETHFQDIQVEEKIVHEGYSTYPQIVHDIALLRLMNPVDFSHRNVAPICLPATEGMRNMYLDDKKVTVAGWGVMETGRESVLLRKVDIPIVKRDTCVRKYEREISGSGIPKKIHENQICAGQPMRDSCTGDSGSPMMLESEYRGSYRIVQYGLVSYGSKNCGSSFPGVYTNVAKYMDWILDHMRE